MSLVFLAPADISATLYDDQGEIVGKNLAGTPESINAFRTISVKKPFQSGKWKLKLESREPAESEIVITGFIDYKSDGFQVVKQQLTRNLN